MPVECEEAGNDMWLLRERELHPGWGLSGDALHGAEGVASSRWCVTKADLKLLRAQIKQAVREGNIQPTPRDKFCLKDDNIGPNMYTVVDQYIKPLTEKAGNMSWALLRNPKGLDCQLFITHAWSEGAFEFLDKVLVSWPHSAYGAWICILANPQNLDINHLIAVPRRSPFALALKQASKVMVVPNRQCSIYTRIWCVYEAYLAMSWKKEVFTACAPENRWQSMLPHVVLAMVWLFVGKRTVFTDHGFKDLPRPHVSLLLLALAVLARLLLELPRRRQRLSEGEALLSKFVDAAQAQSSSQTDKEKILFEIRSKIEDVNRAVASLQRVGMFTPGITHALERNAILQGMGDPSRPMMAWAACVFQVVFFMYSNTQGIARANLLGCFIKTIVSLAFSEIHVNPLMTVDLVCGIVKLFCLALVAYVFEGQSLDGKAFNRCVTTKLTGLTIAASAAVYATWLVWTEVDLTFLNIVLTVVTVVAASLACLGVVGTASIPLVGRWMAEALWPGYWRGAAVGAWAGGGVSADLVEFSVSKLATDISCYDTESQSHESSSERGVAGGA